MADVIALTGGLLRMLAESKPHADFRAVSGIEAVDKMLNSDPARRFKVYKRDLNYDGGDAARENSGSFAHWLFVSEDGKHGFGFNRAGEEVELPKSLAGYELHPDYLKNSFSAEGLVNARRAREQELSDMYQYAEDNPWLFYDSGAMPDLYSYNTGLNNCQHYIQNIIKHYKE